MARQVPHAFFDRPAACVARELIGCDLCVQRNGKTVRYAITETEAYVGPHDRASHASRGKTPRNEVMFRKAGTIYVYFVYGMHEMLNLVTGKEGYPAAVLIRGVAGFRGPGKLTKALGITRTLNGKTLGTTTGLWVESPTCARIYRILRTPRIGVSYAHEWAGKKLRFIAQESTGGASRTHRP